MYVITALTLAFLPLASAVDIYHRIHNPPHSPPPFTLRGRVDISPSGYASYIPTESFRDDVARITEIASSNPDTALYQVALRHEGQAKEDEWVFSSVKACHAASSTADFITLRTSSSLQPFAISYSVIPVPNDGLCVPTSPKPSSLFSNTTVLVRTPNAIPPLELRPPPLLSPQGEPIKPEPPQGFIQKYWMYALPVVMLLVMLPSGDEPPAQGGGQAK